MSSFFYFSKNKNYLADYYRNKRAFWFSIYPKETTPPPPEPPQKIEVIDQSSKVASITPVKIKEETKIEVKTGATTVLKRETLAENEKRCFLIPTR